MGWHCIITLICSPCMCPPTLAASERRDLATWNGGTPVQPSCVQRDGLNYNSRVQGRSITSTLTNVFAWSMDGCN